MNPDNEAAPDASLDPIAEHFQQLSHRMEQLAQGLADGMARLESRMEAVGAQMLALESRTDVLASLVSAVETRLSTLELRQTPSAPAAGVQATAFATAESVQRRLDTMERQIGAVQSALTDLRFRFALSRSSASEAERRYTATR